MMSRKYFMDVIWKEMKSFYEPPALFDANKPHMLCSSEKKQQTHKIESILKMRR